MPTLYILAGPNGAGKTTYFETAVAEGFIDANLPFINVDLITRSLPGMYTEQNFVKADTIAREKITQYINDMADFMIESNLATQRDYDWIKAMIKRSYDVVLYFLCNPFWRLIQTELRNVLLKEVTMFLFQSLNIVTKWGFHTLK